MQTKPIYLEDSYKKNCRAKILEITTKDNLATVILDQTVFYPVGGGQPSDQGVIEGKKGKLIVEQVILKGNEVKHIGKLDGELKNGQEVFCEIDWERRYHNMQVHSAGHILHETVKHLFPDLTPIEGEHGKHSYIKYKGNLEQISERLILNKANAIVNQKLPINTEFVSLEDLKKRAAWIPEHLPKNKPLRIMWIGNFPPIPDGGTQVKNSYEIGSFEYIQVDNLDDNVVVTYRITQDKSDQSAKSITYSQPETILDSSTLLNDKNQAIARISAASDPEEIEQIRIELFGKSGLITNATKKMRNLKNEDKKQLGILINEIKQTLELILTEKKNNLNQNTGSWFDPTFPTPILKIGHFHPTSIVVSEIVEIFKHLGFSVVEGPEIETDRYNFELLNLPKDHPARSLQDVLYIEEPEILLRSQTSSVETRSIERLKPPFRAVVAGKCYRFENVNASNNAMFYQFQGFALQKGLSMADLKGTLFYFVKNYFGETRKIRYRCKYYPEVEPGVGLDLDCLFCNQKGCPVCKGRGWIEMLGAGMIHPNILKNFGYNPKIISGFAFGMGLDRIVMDRFKINDIRSLYNGDIKY